MPALLEARLADPLMLVAAVRKSISDDGAAMEAVDAAQVLERLLQPGR